jgi:uncharacterized protein YlxW (UPF0749 family)
MSDEKINLDFLGEQMLRMQADMRGVRSEQVKLESEQTSLRADFRRLETKVDGLDAKVDGLDAKVDRLDAKVDRLDATMNLRLTNLEASMDARFDQVNQTAATNLAVVLNAIEAKS